MLYNIITNQCYVGRSISLAKRFSNYYNDNYLNNNINRDICKDLLEQYKENFYLEILEYCDHNEFLGQREQYYIDIINPEYNKQKTAKYSKRQGYLINIINIKDNSNKTYCSIAEAAKSLGISSSTVSRYLNNKVLKSTFFLLK
jgi:Fic family protein